jgi:hypothetical protein
MFLRLSPSGQSGPATWRVLVIDLIAAIIGVSVLAYLLVFAAKVALG